MIVLVMFCVFVCCLTQSSSALQNHGITIGNSIEIQYPRLAERIGNFSIELLHHTMKLEPNNENLVLSPITLWTLLAAVTEAATANTAIQLKNALRIWSGPNARHELHRSYKNLQQWLHTNTSDVQFEKVVAIFLDTETLLYRDFKDLAKSVYSTDVIPLNFSDSEKIADTINEAVSLTTHGRITKLVEASFLNMTRMILASAVYFKGQWKVSFDPKQTRKMNFHDSAGQKVGEVNMMSSRYAYPLTHIKGLSARVIELPYTDDLSMLVMLPDTGLSPEDMLLNFRNVALETVFNELRLAKEQYGDDKIDCLIPRFKLESNLELAFVLQRRMGVVDLFNETAARLGRIARTPVFVSKVIHRVEIEVAEEGREDMSDESTTPPRIMLFIANRPFSFMVVEKVTKSIVLLGLYKYPILY